MDVMVFLFKIQEAVNKSLEDGKITIADAINLVPVAKALPAVIDGFTTIPDSFADLDKDDHGYFVAEFAERFDLEDDEVEEFVEMAFDCVVLLALVILKGADVFGKEEDTTSDGSTDG